MNKLEEKIRQAYDQGYCDSKQEERNGFKPELNSREYAQKKAEELWPEDRWIEDRSEDQYVNPTIDPEDFSDGAKWLRNELFGTKGNE